MADEIRAEMVANVWKVVAGVGDEVSEGDTLVILESMKMEIPVLAESDGTLAQLAVNEGDVVQEAHHHVVVGPGELLPVAAEHLTAGLRGTRLGTPPGDQPLQRRRPVLHE